MTSIIHPDNRPLLCLLIGLQALLISLLLYQGETTLFIGVLLLVSVSAALFSTTGGIFILAFLTVVIPSEVLEEKLLLPLNFKFYEGLYALVLAFAAVEWTYKKRFAVRQTALDRPMLGLLVAILLSVFVGLYRGHGLSRILPDVRFPLYYSIFFIAANLFEPRRAPHFVGLLIAAATVVAAQYLLAFFAGVNLSVAGTFTRIVRAEGVMLPIAMLFVLSLIVFYPSPVRRGALLLLFLPLAMALVITVTRAIWASFAVGLLALGVLLTLDRQRPKGRLTRTAQLLVAVPLLILATAYGFQALTGAGLSDVASYRSSSAAQFSDDPSLGHRLLSYAVALDQILAHPILGNGHGATITYPMLIYGRMNVVTTSHIDSLYIVLLHRLGLVGLSLFAWLALRALRRAYCLFQASDSTAVRTFCAGFIAALINCLVAGLGDAAMFVGRFVFIYALLFALLALLDREEQSKRA
ncbi:MAG: hypothetical protein A3F84_07030 [Candidatus Handelsmanbacteria bacterium RIFCSPLOWO2_12_FULL_64_10]|uniref:O-antigen ligase-related domain-containing protein n=1 Tax=Handelsmanbacteria sp. (strain RIFCSPLOWO2_12_FULL_64_10) TaxID=1817868 RepID=A0A1F6CDH1_HANXR|nr:MAG: hypothetical protein A3F84_07030 [Candidatus Handelsmanbacteria bacterium RIFCSPLOWO2_12_FULL_64_10]